MVETSTHTPSRLEMFKKLGTELKRTQNQSILSALVISPTGHWDIPFLVHDFHGRFFPWPG
jgi:hypothetical protein